MLMSDSFAREADMYSPVAACADILASTCGGAVKHFFQVKATAGIPDLVLAIFDEEELECRSSRGLAPIVDAVGVSAMTFLADRRAEVVSTGEVATAIGMSPGYLSSDVLPCLAVAGHVSKVARGKWQANHTFRSTVQRLVTVEAKVAAWKRALWQAQRHAVGADMAWVILDGAAVRPALSNLTHFQRMCIGMAGLNISGSLTVHQPAPARVSRRVARTVLAERVTRLHLLGESEWEWSSMFGSDRSRVKAAATSS
ncbi:hypothetical protein EYA84_23425 [Verrucosispora sp. SN26_14.1]|uniref:hypothetical protein n=1 Tax=Verrucosispora sp. SN26_14.1 TaxID=2527879 RepID=UPI0010335C6E|nr:hypothetical protein [Verrucosispora sp. SN26_14.1]TBL30044.1 hypothetical protein EYA84_23425 [Verrucosispora sp. SN26_14.1]